MSDSDNDKADVLSNNYINDVTLNFLMNKNQHKKYISKTNPEEHDREQKHLKLLCKYKKQIIETTRELLDEPDKQITTDVNEIFDGYTKTLIRYFKMKEIENNDFHNISDYDVLFGNMDDSGDDEPVEEGSNNTNGSDDIYSFWGKKVLKSK